MVGASQSAPGDTDLEDLSNISAHPKAAAEVGGEKKVSVVSVRSSG